LLPVYDTARLHMGGQQIFGHSSKHDENEIETRLDRHGFFCFYTYSLSTASVVRDGIFFSLRSCQSKVLILWAVSERYLDHRLSTWIYVNMISVLCILIFRVLGIRRDDNNYWAELR
jgi:hypothetical protein